ncbi:MAG: DinB family protein [Bacteroidetes bacterium]|nr:MAG: DinB family protein [Bacteroidota bacterium]
MKHLFTMTFAVLMFIGTLDAQDMPKGFRGDFLAQMKDVEEKIIGLAEAMPQEKYTWRPMEGVRSVSEVFMHIAGGNYLFPKFIGVKAPEGLSQDMEKTVTDKAKVKEVLKLSFEHIRKAVMEMKDNDLENPVKMFGKETTFRDAIFTAATHMHEHLGQAIAYARMNAIVPPWTAAEQAEQAKKK